MCLTSSCKEYRPTPSLPQVTQNPGIHTHYIVSYVIYFHSLIKKSLTLITWNDDVWETLLCLFETDVVYDPDIIACLVRLLSMLLNCKVQEKHPDVYIVSAVRNPQTYDCFKKELGRFHIIKNNFYSIIVKYFLNSWFPINNEMFFYLQKWLDWDTSSWKILSLKYFHTTEPPL